MKGTEEKQLDNVMSKAIQKAAVQSPSNDFTQTLMHKIQAAQTSQTTIVYQPLISRRIWGLLGIIFGLLIGYVNLSNISFTAVSDLIEETSDTMGTWNVPAWEFPSIDFSLATTSPFVYGALILVGFLFVEIVVLKRKYS
ncbi:hypothetical protein [uncultured Dokdonia sp.]|uniref:hypothetical protein n=1 Tax=uncultured Dokdonia sp. TaxID=575653 RepID=UPI00261C3A53|nr:hypothetical protein [uncultured Dokdonia sp.]